MVPAGYMAKRVVAPEGMGLKRVSTIYSVSGCIAENFTDYINYWKHNGYWFFDSPEIIIDIARENRIDLVGTVLCFYEVHEREFDGEWTHFDPEASFGTDVNVPEARVLEGYDVVTFSAGTSPECSPLSCNGLAADVQTNARCLLESFEQARSLLENGTFDHSEPGPYGFSRSTRLPGRSALLPLERRFDDDAAEHRLAAIAAFG